MAYKDLRDFIKVLEQKGRLKRITTEVDPILEITEIADRMVKLGGPALFFEKVKGSNIPVVINLFSTQEQMNWALEVNDVEEIANRIREFMHLQPPTGLWDKIMMLPKLGELANFIPKVVKTGPCKEVIIKDNIQLSKFPIPQCWPKDGGRYITLPMCITKDPRTGIRNSGMYRIQVYDEKTTGMHFQIHKHAARHEEVSGEMGKKLEMAVAIGGDPVSIYAASAPCPDNIDEFLLAGFIRREPVEMVKCETVDLEVPAHAEIILEGYVDPKERRVEGPFGDHNGYYSPPAPYPVFHITCITHRKDPIYPTTIVGKPLMEDYFMGNASVRIFLPLIQTTVPEIVDMHFPAEGVFHNCCIVSIKKSYPGHARKVMHALWGLGQLMFSKLIIVVEHHVNVHNLSEVAWVVLNGIDAKRDVVIVEGPVDDLDHVAPTWRYGAKMGIDATRKTKEEGQTREQADEIFMSDEIKKLVDKRWKEYGL